MDIVLEPQRKASIEEYEDSDKANNNKIIELLNTNRPVLVIVYLFSIFRFRVHNNEVVPITKKMKLLCYCRFTFRCIAHSLDYLRPSAVQLAVKPSFYTNPICCVCNQNVFLFESRKHTLFTTLVDLDVKLHVKTYQDFYKKSHRVTVTTFIMEQSLEVNVSCLMIMMLNRRLNIINNYLIKFIDEKDDNKACVFVIRGKKDTILTKIRDLASTYDIIGESFATFIGVVIVIWSSLVYYKNGEYPGSLITTTMWSVIEIFMIAYMSMTCEKLLRSRSESKVLVNKIIMDYDLPQTMRVRMASADLINDMFSVDITLMLKYISVSTTYLIVILQISHLYLGDAKQSEYEIMCNSL
ncbi:hypothetical protein ABMA28_002606 [Loxostege sticticalis]|uniref:Gustatory receptor n=1 Tax=Loxostege sticticalis TaxID=481309 RepID=A0ABD0SXF8_LOXSC